MRSVTTALNNCKKLSLANLQTKKTKKEFSFRQPTKGKAKFIKNKIMSTNTFYCRYKGHVASNDLLDINTKSLSCHELSQLVVLGRREWARPVQLVVL